MYCKILQTTLREIFFFIYLLIVNNARISLGVCVVCAEAVET